jgi:hypothetical protein
MLRERVAVACAAVAVLSCAETGKGAASPGAALPRAERREASKTEVAARPVPPPADVPMAAPREPEPQPAIASAPPPPAEGPGAAPREAEPEAATAAVPPPPARPKWKQIPLEALDVTLGRLAPGAGGRLRVDSPKMRAQAPAYRQSAAALRFTYLGPTATVAPLASGEERRQLGLKLRARDGCNVLYVMWRLAPVPGVVVQVKQNPGATTSAACGAHGYRTVRPLRASRPPDLVPGATHVLAARLDHTHLSVAIDGKVVWDGQVDAGAAALEGPIGLRTDNVRCELELLGEEE